MDLKLKEKTIMVAAASSGLGFGIAEALAAEGAQLALSSRTDSNLELAKARLLEAHPVHITTTVCDVADLAAIEKWVENTVTQFGRVDGFVVNAGGPSPGTIDTLSEADWEKAYHLTLMSAVRLIRCVLPHMRRQRSGSIITVTSSSVKEPIEALLLSNVFRAGVASLVKSVSREVAHEGIRINNLVPGRFDTSRVREIDAAIANRRGITPSAVKESQESGIPSRRYGQPNEFGKAAAFLLSDAASYITGSSLVVDGGKTLSL